MLAISKNRLDAIQSSNFALRELGMNFHRIGLAHQFADPGDQWRPHVDIDLGRRKNDDLLRVFMMDVSIPSDAVEMKTLQA